MSTEAPNHAYYRANHGEWRSDLDFTVTDWARFTRCPMSLTDKLRIASVALTPGWMGSFTLATTVDYLTRGEQGVVGHSTRVSKWGVTFMDSVEWLRLSGDGRGFTMEGEQRFWPTMGARRSFSGAVGSVDPTGLRAEYELPFFGTLMRQKTQIEGGCVRVEQLSDWSFGVQRLRRVSADAG